jgi:RimJ/RimL family protein N-acetyltransferase
VGTVGLSQIDWGGNCAEYGILLGEPAARGQGVAYRASQIVLRYGFEILGLDKVSLRAFADNDSARRLYEGLGFTPIPGADPRTKDGVVRPVLEMVLTRAAWDSHVQQGK